MPNASRPISAGLSRIGQTVLANSTDPETSDARLLARFIASGDPEAFEMLVTRHGSMVLAVCRRVAKDSHLADEAFQAVFLVLIRRAATIRPREAVRGWLYGVAVRTARTARTRTDRRRKRELSVPTLPDRPAPLPLTADPDELLALDEEIAGLPDWLRSVVVLCELDGLSRKDAAVRLGIPEGTLSSRLAKARKLLAAALRARGVVPAAGLGSLLSQSPSRAAVPPPLAAATVRLATPGAVPAGVNELLQGVLRTMLMEKLKSVTIGGLFACGLVGMLVAVDPLPAEACHRFVRVARAPTVWVCPAPAPPVVVTPVVSAPPVMPPPVATQPPAATVDPKLAAHLAAWEKQREGFTNVYASLEVTKTESVFKRERHYLGSVLHMRPDFTRLRLDNVADPTKADYEAYIRNGNVLYEYNGLLKTITEYHLNDKKIDLTDLKSDDKVESVDPASWWGKFLARMFSVSLSAERMPISVLSQISAKEYLERYQITLFKEDNYYLYLDIKPRDAADRQEFEQIRIALMGPKVKAPLVPYSPAQLYILRPNGDTESWRFKETRWNVPGVTEKAFECVKIPGWQLKSIPAKKPEAEQPPEEVKSVERPARLMDVPTPILPAVDPPPPNDDKPPV